MIAINQNNTFLRHFESWEEYLHRAIHGKSALKDHKRSSRVGFGELYGTDTFDEAVKLALNGWPEGRENIKNITQKISHVLASKIVRPQARYSETGEEVDVPRFVSGDPEHFIDYPMSVCNGHGNIVRVGVSLSTSGDVEAQYIHNRGAAIVALIDALETVGYRVELDFMNASKNGSAYYDVMVPIKQADQPCELDRIAFVFAHAANQRRIGFSVNETDTKEVVKKFGFYNSGGYGEPADSKTKNEYDFYFGFVYSGTQYPWTSSQSATVEILRLCKSTGIIELTES